MDTTRPHRMPPSALKEIGELIAWKCDACGAIINETRPTSPCPIDWRGTDPNLLKFQVERRLSYSRAVYWICNCGTKAKFPVIGLQQLLEDYEKHLRMIHQIVPEEEPL